MANDRGELNWPGALPEPPKENRNAGGSWASAVEAARQIRSRATTEREQIRTMETSLGA
jgi:hypothetical protein